MITVSWSSDAREGAVGPWVRPHAGTVRICRGMVGDEKSIWDGVRVRGREEVGRRLPDWGGAMDASRTSLRTITYIERVSGLPSAAIVSVCLLSTLPSSPPHSGLSRMSLRALGRLKVGKGRAERGW